MFPITKPALSFGDIADYWSREIHPPASWEETLRTLESAWWLGELRGNSGPTRLQRLKNMFTSMRHRDELGIVFVVGDCAGPRPVELPDGSLQVDLRHQIRVPSNDTESWDEAACTDAFKALAKTSSKESYPDLTVGFTLTELSYQEFNAWRAKRAYHEANFWKPQDQLVAPQERKTWQAKPRCVLSETENAVLKAINEIWPDGILLDHKAKARDERIRDRLGRAQQSTVSVRTIQRTLKKIHFV
jgi:hypothetical protein